MASPIKKLFGDWLFTAGAGHVVDGALAYRQDNCGLALGALT